MINSKLFDDKLIQQIDEPNENTEDSNENSDLNVNNLNQARIYRLYTVLLFTLSNFTFKILSSKWKSNCVFQSCGLRFLIMFTICKFQSFYTSTSLYSFYNISIYKPKIYVFMLRCLFTAFANIFFYLSLGYLKVGISICINMTSPILQNILSYFIFKETLSIKYLLLCSLSMIGVYLILNNGSSLDKEKDKNENTSSSSFFLLLTGLLLSFLSSFSTAFLYISTKMLNSLNISIHQLNYSSSFLIGAVNFFVAIFFFSESNFLFLNCSFLFFHLLIGFSSYCCFYYLGLSTKLADISKTSFITYLQLPIISVLGYFVYNEDYSFYEIIGICLILFSLLYGSILK
jgi:drug/metabolite transporter (DMT)-like permease